MVIECEQGYSAGGVGGDRIYDNDDNAVKAFKSTGGGGHSQNFVNAIRSRKAGDLNTEIEIGHTSAALSHMANISYRTRNEDGP